MSERLPVTPSQTVGPFFHLGLDRLATTTPDPIGPLVTVEGTVIDGAGAPVPDALIETWQADAHGVHATDSAPATLRGFTRVATDDAGHFRIRTTMPGRASGPDGTQQAPHLLVVLFMRGLLRHLFTRLYFPDGADTETDPILKLVDAARRRTLIATRQAGSPGVFKWDIHLQGDDETVFFDV
jgi:protocatechuate 3,4-dioxygenase, alpha subunit